MAGFGCPPRVLRVSPFAFHHYASEYLQGVSSARTRAGVRYSPVPYFLCCRALELVIKAFLLARGVSKDSLKKRAVGHNLDVVLAMARKHGLDVLVALEPQEEEALLKASPQYSTKEFEYFEIARMVRRGDLPKLDFLESAATKLVKGLRQVCVEAA